MRRRTGMPRTVELFGERGAVCFYCGQAGTEGRGPDGLYWQRDHMTPVSKGGSNEPDNIALSCATCNSKKSDLTAEAYMQKLRLADLETEFVALGFNPIKIRAWWDRLNETETRYMIRRLKECEPAVWVVAHEEGRRQADNTTQRVRDLYDEYANKAEKLVKVQEEIITIGKESTQLREHLATLRQRRRWPWQRRRDDERVG